jgi:hypothetical protein
LCYPLSSSFFFVVLWCAIRCPKAALVLQGYRSFSVSTIGREQPIQQVWKDHHAGNETSTSVKFQVAYGTELSSCQAACESSPSSSHSYRMDNMADLARCLLLILKYHIFMVCTRYLLQLARELLTSSGKAGAYTLVESCGWNGAASIPTKTKRCDVEARCLFAASSLLVSNVSSSPRKPSGLERPPHGGLWSCPTARLEAPRVPSAA